MIILLIVDHINVINKLFNLSKEYLPKEFDIRFLYLPCHCFQSRRHNWNAYLTFCGRNYVYMQEHGLLWGQNFISNRNQAVETKVVVKVKL